MLVGILLACSDYPAGRRAVEPGLLVVVRAEAGGAILASARTTGPIPPLSTGESLRLDVPGLGDAAPVVEIDPDDERRQCPVATDDDVVPVDP